MEILFSEKGEKMFDTYEEYDDEEEYNDSISEEDDDQIFCAVCGMELNGEEYLVVGDNYLQANYFDSEKDNRFCGVHCLCKALSTLIVFPDGSHTDY